MLYVLTTGSGDGSLTVTVDGFGSFGSAIGIANNNGAIYDPIGSIDAASTTFESAVALRVGGSGGRQFLTSGSVGGSGGLSDPVVSGTSTSGSSQFSTSGLNFELLQVASPLLNDAGVQTGSILTQRYGITNPASSTVSFELVRYIDGDLLFDGTLVDGGGRLISNGREFLFETDAGGTGATDTTFLGIDATGGTQPPTNRFEVDSFFGLGQRIIDGAALDGIITGDLDGDGFIEPGQEYDVTLAMRNTFTLSAGESATFTTRTVFGSGNPEDIPIDPLISPGPDVLRLEGDSGLTPFVFTVSVAEETNSTIVVDYTTVDGSAIAGIDYEAQNGTLTFTAGGPRTQAVTVNVIGDETIENNETFLLRLSSAGLGVLDDDEAVGIILNDDVELSVGDVRVVEGDSGTTDAVFTVSALGAVNTDIQFGYTTLNGTAVAGSDYLARAGTGRLPRGASTARITVPIVGDRLNEATETFFVALVSATGARIDDASGTGTIVDTDPLPNFYVSDVQVTTTTAGTSEAVFTVALDAPSGREVVVEFATSDGVALDGLDYQAQAGPLTFSPGTLNRTVSVPVFTDGTYTANRHFFLELANPLNARMADPRGRATIVYAQETAGERIVDNGNAGFSQTGQWTNVTNTVAYGLDYGHHAAGDGSGVATWTFPDLPAGSYQVFARWSWFVNRATNAPYTILDGATPLDTISVNQQLVPEGDFSEGYSWHELGTFEITSGTLVVRLANNADGFVVADAVRVVAGGIGAPEPEMDVSGFGNSIDLGDDTPALADATDFGRVPVWTDSIVHTYTITNNGNADLHLGDSPRVTLSGAHASDFWIVTQPDDPIAPTRQTTFQLVFHPLQAGLRTAVVSIASDDDNEQPYTFTVQGTGTSGQQELFVLDEATPEFAQVGNWTSTIDPQAYHGRMLSSRGPADGEAIWDFSSLPADRYEVYTTWVPATDRSASAQFTVSNTTDHAFTATVNQQQAPGVEMNATRWARLGALDVDGGSLRVRLGSSGKGVVVADAVMLVGQGQRAAILPFAQNAIVPEDVNGDGRVSPFDALVVTNNLLVQSAFDPQAPTPLSAHAAPSESGALAAPRAEGEVVSHYVDVNADGRVSPFDLLRVVNYLLGHSTATGAAPLAQPSTRDASPLAAVAVDAALSQTAVAADLGSWDVPTVDLAEAVDPSDVTELPAGLLLEPDASEATAADEPDDPLDALFAEL